MRMRPAGAAKAARARFAAARRAFGSSPGGGREYREFLGKLRRTTVGALCAVPIL